MEEIWKRIEAWLKENAPEVLEGLNPGAKAKDLQATEKHLGVKLPDDVKASYRIHDGQSDRAPALMAPWQLLPLAGVRDEWDTMKDLHEKGVFSQAPGRPVGPVRPDWYNLKWVPVMHNGGGDLYCLDLDPPAKGKAGQVITVWHMDDKREKLAPSFEAFLRSFAADLKKGKYEVKGGKLTAKK